MRLGRRSANTGSASASRPTPTRRWSVSAAGGHGGHRRCRACIREAPVNAIWEGSGNVQCLDIARAIQRSPQALQAYFAEVDAAKGAHAELDAHVAALRADTRDLSDFEARGRDLCDRLALGLQAAALLRAGSPVAGAFARARLETRGARNYGALTGVDCKAIVKRGAPR